MSSASDKRPPLASVADDGRALVLDSGWAASRDAAGKWTRGIKFWADDLYELFTIVPDAAASALCKDARAALVADAAISFPEGAKFFNVEGIPVVVMPLVPAEGGKLGKAPSATAYDEASPRPFNWDSAIRNGSPVTEAVFRADAGLPPRGVATLPKSFPRGTTFFDVEGVPVVLFPSPKLSATAFPPGSPARPFPLNSVLTNGSPVTEARFREIAGLPAKRPAQLCELVGDDGIPILVQSVYWENVGADAAKALAAAAIARAARR